MHILNLSIFNGGKVRGLKILDLSKSSDLQQLSFFKYFGLWVKLPNRLEKKSGDIN